MRNIEVYVLGVKGCRIKFYPKYFNDLPELDVLKWNLTDNEYELLAEQEDYYGDGYQHNEARLVHKFMLKIAYHAQRLSLHKPSKIYYVKIKNDGSDKWYRDYGVYELALHLHCEDNRTPIEAIRREHASHLSDKELLHEARKEDKKIKHVSEVLCRCALDLVISLPIAERYCKQYDRRSEQGINRVLQAELAEAVALGDPTI